MSQISGTYRNGAVRLDESVNWPEGTPVQVTVADQVEQDLCMDGAPWPRTPEEIQEWLNWFESREPVFDSEEEVHKFNEYLAESKAEQKELERKNWDQLDKLFP